MNIWNFNETLTNDVVSYEQPAQKERVFFKYWPLLICKPH